MQKFWRALPRHGKIAALDVGTRHVGVAVSDEGRQFVSPMTTFSRSKSGEWRNGSIAVQSFSKKMQEFVDKENCCGFVVGIPLKDGETTPFCKEIVDLMLNINCTAKPQNQLRMEQDIDDDNDNYDKDEMFFTLWDEYNSTMESRRHVARTTNKRSVFMKHKDSMAAAVILQKMLEHYNTS